MDKIENGFTIWARQTIESDIFFYKSDKWFKIWFYIVNKVFHMKGRKFERGEALITYEEIMKATKATKQQTKDCIHYLEKEHMIESKQTTRGKIRKVVNYEIYQDSKNYKTTNRPQDRPLADHQQTPPIDNNERMKEQEYIYINKFSQEEKEKIKENLKGKTIPEIAHQVVEGFNKVLNKKYKDEKSFLKGLEKVLVFYSLDELSQAIMNIKNGYWKDIMTPIMLFQQKNPRGEPVNYIDLLINQKDKYGRT